MKFIFFANTDWYLYNFRLSTALRLKDEGHEVVMLSPPGEFGQRFAAHGLRWRVLSMDRASLNPLRECVTLGRLVGVLREEKPDLLHNFTVKCAIYGALAAKFAGVPAVVNAVAGMGFVFTSDTLKARLLRPAVKLLMKAALGSGNSLLILQNPDDAQIFADHRLVAAERIRVIRSSGVNTRRFRPRDEPSIAGATPESRPLKVLLAARLLWEKGIREFADAATLLKQRGRHIEFYLAGMPDPGNPHSATRAEVEQWQQSGVLTWLKHVEDMPALLNTMDVMALPSYYREGVPKSLIEGAASGLAIITTDQPGCREVVTQDGVDGIIVAPRDAAALAECIERLDRDRSLLRRVGQRARDKALAEFDETIVISRTLDVYAELAPRHFALHSTLDGVG